MPRVSTSWSNCARKACLLEKVKMRSKLSLPALIAMLIVASNFGSLPATADPPTRASIENKSPEEKAALLQKKERFDNLSPEEQDRLRALNTAITTSEQAPALLSTLDRYHEWLKSLTAK